VKAVAGAQGLYDVVLAVSAVPHAALPRFTAVVHKKHGVQIHAQMVPIPGPTEYQQLLTENQIIGLRRLAHRNGYSAMAEQEMKIMFVPHTKREAALAIKQATSAMAWLAMQAGDPSFTGFYDMFPLSKTGARYPSDDPKGGNVDVLVRLVKDEKDGGRMTWVPESF